MNNDIEKLCFDKERELLKRYFGELARQAAIERPETIGEFTKELPLKIEGEYREFLVELWKNHSDDPLVLEERKLRSLLTENLHKKVEEAYKDAREITLWEKITKSNHKDVSYYKGLLKEYTKELLDVMRIDFLEEITGKHISGKAFDE